MNRWGLTHSRNGWSLRLTETPIWAYLAESAAESLCQATGDRLCNPPAWTWNVVIGDARYSDGEERPLGSYLHGLATWLFSFTDRHETRVAQVEITPEQAEAINPQWFFEITSMLDDVDDNVSGDAARWRPERSGQ